jgi:hypothetical protein
MNQASKIMPVTFLTPKTDGFALEPKRTITNLAESTQVEVPTTFNKTLHGSEEEGYSVSYSALWAPAIDAMQKRRSDPITFKTLTV